MDRTFPDAHYAILASRLVPGADGGFKVAVLARARQMAASGANGGRGPFLLTVDPTSPTEHAEHRRNFVRRGLAASEDLFRNLFDEAIADAAWLRAASSEGAATPGIEYRTIADAEGTPVLSLPVIRATEWQLTDANVVVHGEDGDRVLCGFRGLYRAWLDHVVAGLRAQDPRPVVIVCESRQIGELLAGWRPPGVCLVHTIHTSHLEPPYLPGSAMNELWKGWFDAIDGFDAVLWPTRQQRDDVVARFGWRDTYAVVPNAVSFVASEPAPPERGRVVTVGRLASGKRIDHTLHAWRRVVRVVPDARLEIFGDGPLREHLAQLVERLGLSGSVTLRGHVDGAARAFDGAEVMVQSTAYEGQGLAALEAVSRGCPVVSYDMRYGPRDLLADGGGILVPDGDIDALATAVVAILSDRELRDRLSREAVSRAAEYTPERTMSAMADAVGRALAHAAARGSSGDDGRGDAVQELILPA